MKSFKTHLGLILPLLFMMFAFEFILIINQTVKHYESLLNKDYSIIIASSKELSQTSVQNQIPSLQTLQSLDTKSFMQRLKNDVSASNLAALERSLPHFYSLKLNHLPTQSELKELKDKLSKMPNVIRVEAFAKTYDKIYSLLVLIKFVFWLFLFIIILLSFVLFLKQMRIWLFEHTERVEIMCLFGAPFWFRSFMLYRVVLFDCFIAFLILLVFFTQIFSLGFIQSALNAVDISLPKMNFILHLSIIFALSLLVSLLCVNSVMFKVKK
ncbi:cell division protein FtsX [Campylobacter sp. MIT 12-8780]|uniref:FtsX-like permease family protein n=1 Tax=Campylobacter sp. MIT 12-8780 TaxID=2202200 RepID=UPI00115DF983|nr:FtsX-like permease family protein [Campylobacter sp. MIT 12-8780]TQR41014.1 cell division protein FtsX [Campylobacter sp. MIT 12-8780]